MSDNQQLAQDARAGYQVLHQEIAYGAPGQDQDIDTVARAIAALAKYGSVLLDEAKAAPLRAPGESLAPSETFVFSE